MSGRTLIIKLGALGDVLRTTPILHVLEGDIYWVTKKEAIDLLPRGRIKRIIDIEEAKEALCGEHFDLVLSLDDDYEAAELASWVNKKTLIGSYLKDGRITYTEYAKEWFDMGLISKYGKEVADELKKRNKKTYQEILFRMIGKEFKGEEYIINYFGAYQEERNYKVIGIESRAGDRWPTKRWNKYEALADLLRQDGYEVIFFKQRNTLREYIEDINQCSLVITGDTLALHIALALRKKVVALFTCTSPTEIYDYGRLRKIVSPMLDKAFYKRKYVPEAVEAITLEEVYATVKEVLEEAK